MTTFNDLIDAGFEQIGRSWGWFLVLGILLAILGVRALPRRFCADSYCMCSIAIFRGVTGYLLIRHPDAGAEALTLLLASLFVVGDVFRGVAANAIRFPT